jgi:hypothetical protein
MVYQVTAFLPTFTQNRVRVNPEAPEAEAKFQLAPGTGCRFYLCRKIKHRRGRLILIDSRVERDGRARREGTVILSGLPYIVDRLAEPEWWSQ